MGKMPSMERSGADLTGTELHAERHPHRKEGMTAVYVFCNVFGPEITPYTVHAYCTSKRLISELCILKSMSTHGNPHAVPFSLHVFLRSLHHAAKYSSGSIVAVAGAVAQGGGMAEVHHTTMYY